MHTNSSSMAAAGVLYLSKMQMRFTNVHFELVHDWNASVWLVKMKKKIIIGIVELQCVLNFWLSGFYSIIVSCNYVGIGFELNLKKAFSSDRLNICIVVRTYFTKYYIFISILFIVIYFIIKYTKTKYKKLGNKKR